jgi:TolB-like protein
VRHHSAALLTVLATLTLTAPALAQGKSKKASIAVAPFTYHNNVRRKPGTELETGAFTKKFITSLGKSNKFDVVERDSLDTLFTEMKLSDAGFTDPSRAVKAGEMFGVDYFLMGEISVWTVSSRSNKIPRMQRYRRTVDMHLIVDMRIVNARTSKIVATEKGEITRTWQSGLMKHLPPAMTRLEPVTTDGVERELCAQLVKKVIDTIYPLKILKVNSSGMVFVNRGEGGGINEGDVYDVFQPGEAMIDPDTGEDLGTDETKIGRIRISQVLPKFSKAEAVAGAPKAGNICRAARGEANFAPPPPPPPPADTTPPVITILAPRKGQTLNQAPITIVAQVTDNESVSRVTINGVDAGVDAKGRYRVQISKPNDGRNGIRVQAWDAAGNAATANGEFSFDSTPPEVEAQASILVEGKVDDLTCTLTVNGATVAYDKTTGAYSVRVAPNPSNPTKVLIVATDEFGNKTTEVRNIQ